MRNFSARRLVVARGVAAGLVGTAGVAWAAGGSGRSSGPDYAYGTLNPFEDATASVHVVRTGNDRVPWEIRRIVRSGPISR